MTAAAFGEVVEPWAAAALVGVGVRDGLGVDSAADCGDGATQLSSSESSNLASSLSTTVSSLARMASKLFPTRPEAPAGALLSLGPDDAELKDWTVLAVVGREGPLRNGQRRVLVDDDEVDEPWAAP